MDKVVAADHPDCAGGIVWSKCELEWINTKLEQKAKNQGMSDLADLMQKSLEEDTSRIGELLDQVEQQAARIKELEGAIERMRVAGGSAEFHRMFELAKDLL